jgi:hypothetical protein
MSLHTISVHRTVRTSYGIRFYLKVIALGFVGVVAVSLVLTLVRKLFARRPTAQRVVTALVLTILIVGCSYWIVERVLASRREQRELETHEAMRRQQLREAIAALAASNQAIDDWRSSLCAGRLNSPLLTADLQEVLDRANGRPLLFSGLLKDVKKESGSYIVSLSSHVCGGTSIHLELSMEPSYLPEVSAHRADIPYFTVAALPISVQKRVDGSFLMRGRCLAILFTGADGMNAEFE